MFTCLYKKLHVCFDCLRFPHFFFFIKQLKTHKTATWFQKKRKLNLGSNLGRKIDYTT